MYLFLTIYFIYWASTSFIQYKSINTKQEGFQSEITKLVLKQVLSMSSMLLLLNFPTIALWQYMRKNNFMASELLTNHYLLQFIGLDFILLSTIILTFPAVFLYTIRNQSYKKTTFDKILIALVLLILVIIVCMIVNGLIYNSTVALPTVIFLVAFYWYFCNSFIFIHESWKNKKISSRKLLHYAMPPFLLIALIFIPCLTLEGLTQNTFNRIKLGGFSIKIQTHNNQNLDGFLLLKTTDFYYINPIKNGVRLTNNVQIIDAKGTNITYNTVPEIDSASIQ